MNRPSPHHQTYIVLFILSLVFSVPAMLYAAWSFYDGTVYYPDQMQRYQQFQQLQAAHPDDWQTRWVGVANQNGWPTDTPKEVTEFHIITQYIMTGFCGFIGLALLVAAVVFLVLMKRGAPQMQTSARPVQRREPPAS